MLSGNRNIFTGFRVLIWMFIFILQVKIIKIGEFYLFVIFECFMNFFKKYFNCIFGILFVYVELFEQGFS